MMTRLNNDHLKHQLLLGNEPIEINIRDVSFESISKIKESGLPILIWGLGGMISFIYKNLTLSGVKIEYIIDSDVKKQGLFYEGIEIISYETAKSKLSEGIVLIGVCTLSYVKEITEKLSRDAIFTAVFTELFYPLGSIAKEKISSNINKIEQVYTMLDDKESKEIYCKKIQYMLSKQKTYLENFNKDEQYFDMKIVGNYLSTHIGAFIDCGAYHGENTKEALVFFPNNISQSICIDADKNNIEYMNKYFKFYNSVRMIHAACSRQSGFTYFDNSSERGGQVSENKGELVNAISIDDEFYLSDNKILFIKMDIEGAEYDTLLGARKIIKRDCPVLAICIYHSIEDHWEIPLLIKEIFPRYKVYIRHYHYTGIETVVYAIPPDC